MRVYQFRHVGIGAAIANYMLLPSRALKSTRYDTALSADVMLVDGAHGGTRTPTPRGTWT